MKESYKRLSGVSEDASPNLTIKIFVGERGGVYASFEGADGQAFNEITCASIGFLVDEIGGEVEDFFGVPMPEPEPEDDEADPYWMEPADDYDGDF